MKASPNGKKASPNAKRKTAEPAGSLEPETLMSVLREVRKGNYTVRLPVQKGSAGRLAAELNFLIQSYQQNAEELARRAENAARVAQVLGAVAAGDLSQTMSLENEGRPLQEPFLGTARTVNSMVRQLRTFTSEVTRVAEEVGTHGKLGGQARVRGAAGVWKELTDNVNYMAQNLTSQVRNIAAVTTAVAKGDLSKKITVDVRGEILELKNTINVMVDQLNAFASEVTRVAREVGSEGRLGGQAQVPGVSGTWKDLTDSVNRLAANLTTQVRNIADVTTAVAKGDLTRKITVDVHGEVLQLKNTINEMVDQLNGFASEVTRVAREVGTEGRLGGQASVPGASGTWRDLTDNVNLMAANLTAQVRNIADVTTAVAKGDLSRKITVDVRGEILELKNTINVMVDQLNAFASEVSRVAREVGTEGRLGGQADVQDVAGVWKDLTRNVNQLAANLTSQVRNIAEVTTAVARGDLSKKISVTAQGEILDLKDTINVMVDQLNAFAGEVTRVAREVGTEGKLGGQAIVPGAAGTWKDLTDSVNRLNSTLTTQVRAIADVATAVTEGDLSRSIGVEAQGEVELLKDKINEMIRRLRETTAKNTEQDWLKSNLARQTRMLQGQRDLTAAAQLILADVAPLVGAEHGTLYTREMTEFGQPIAVLRLRAGYAHSVDNLPTEFRLGEGLIGQCAVDKRRIVLSDLPSGAIQIKTGLGTVSPSEVLLIPILFEGEVKAVLELASSHHFTRSHLDYLDQFAESIGIVLNTIEASMRTEELLKQSQTLFVEAQEASRSKSAFLSMAAHELRTPLSVIIGYLSMLQDGTLTGEAARRPIEMLVGKAQELNGIINDLLMAARVERGTVPTQLVRLDLRDAVQEALGRAEPRVDLLKAALSYSAPAGSVFVNVDRDHVGRILDNLVNNALTYTKGRPEIFVAVTADPSPEVVVEDHGVGIPSDLRELVFERFYRIDHPELGPQPGTGLGLFIGRELAQRLGGSLVLDWTEVGKGSRFVLRLPAAPGAEEEIRRVPAREPAARRRPRLSATPLEESRASR